MKRKVYVVVEQGYINNEFVIDNPRQYFTSKNAAALWMEQEKIRLMREDWTIIDERVELCTFGAKKENKKFYFVLWSGIPQ